MKTFKTLLLVVLLAIGLASCEKDPATDDKAPVIKLDSTEIELEARGESLTIGYSILNVAEADIQPIEVENPTDWLAIETSKESIKFSAEKNTSGGGRVATITISYKGAESVSVTVKQPEFKAPTENLSLKLTLTEVGPTSILFDVETSHPDMTWIPMVTYKEYWDQIPNDEEVFISDLAYFEYLAESSGITLEEFLSEMVGTGSQQGIEISQLAPETEYVVYAYGLTTDGQRTTGIMAFEATTTKPYEGDITFTFDIKEEDYIMEFVVTPSHRGVNFYHGLATEAEIEEWKALAGSDNLRDAIQQGSIEAGIETYLNYEFIEERKDYFDMYNEMDIVDDGWEQVKAGTKYILFAAKWDEDCNLMGEVSYTEYTTPKADRSDNIITIEVREVNQSQATVAVKTTNYDPYVVIPIKSADIAGWSDEEIYSYVTTKYDYLVSEYTFMGDTYRTFSRMRPETDYTLLAFGSLAGTMTTDMLKVEITTTASGDPKDCTFTFNVVPSSDTAWLEIDPSDKGHFYHWLIYPAEFTAEEAKSYIKDVLIDKYYDGDIAVFSSWELTQGYETTTAYDLRPETDYKIGVVIMDYETAEFITDVTFSDVFTTTAMEYADITISVEWDKYWDGEALFDYGYTQFEVCDNEAVIPMSVNIEGDYEEFYFAVYNRDLTNEEQLPDDMFYEDLNYGYSMKNTILALPFDTTMTVVAVAYDIMFMPSKVFRKVITLTKDGASPVEEFEEIGGAPSSLATRSLATTATEVVRPERKQSVEIEISDADRAKIESARYDSIKAEVESLKKAKPTKFVAR